MADYNSKVVLKNGTVLMDLTNDTITPETILDGYIAHDKSGKEITGTCDYDMNTQNMTASASDILTGSTAGVRGSVVAGTIPKNGQVIKKISAIDEKAQIPFGHHDGSGYVEIDAIEKGKLIPENIRQGVEILGVEGSMSGSEDVNAQVKTVSPTFSAQTITPDSGYNYLTQVTINAIPIVYTDNAAGGKTVTIG